MLLSPLYLEVPLPLADPVRLVLLLAVGVGDRQLLHQHLHQALGPRGGGFFADGLKLISSF